MNLRTAPRVRLQPAAIDLRSGSRNTPVVFERAAETWPAMERWTFARLKHLYGRVAIPVRQSDDELVEFFLPVSAQSPPSLHTAAAVRAR